MTRSRSILLALAAVVSFALAAEPAAAQMRLNFGLGKSGGKLDIEIAQQTPRRGGSSCFSEQQIAQAIASGEIRSWAAIRRMARIPDAYYETSDVQVCVRNGVPFYEVNMVSPKGENAKYRLNALDGSS
jgi:hypothetical protein